MSISQEAPACPADTREGVPDRRREPRTETNWIAMIRLDDGTEIPCTVKDVSKSGAKLGVPDTVALPASFRLRVLGYEFLFLVRLVWRQANAAGVRIERFGKRPADDGKPAEPEIREEAAETYNRLGTRRSRFSSF